MFKGGLWTLLSLGEYSIPPNLLVVLTLYKFNPTPTKDSSGFTTAATLLIGT